MEPPHTAAARCRTLSHAAARCNMLPEPLPFGASVFSWSLPLWSLLMPPPHAVARCLTLSHAAARCHMLPEPLPFGASAFNWSRSPSEPPHSTGASPMEPPPGALEPPHSSRTRSPSEPPHSTGASPLEPPPGALEPPHSSRTCSPSEPPLSTGASPLEPPPGALGSPPAALELQAVQPLPPGLRLLRLPRRRICVCDGFSGCRHGPHCCHGLHCLLRLDLIPEVLDAQPLAPSLVGGTCGRRPLSSSSTSLRHFRRESSTFLPDICSVIHILSLQE